MTLPQLDNPTYQHRKALYDFCRKGNANDYVRLDALLYSEYGDRPIGELPKLYIDTSTSTGGILGLQAHVFHQFNESWMRLTEDYVSQYQPLENYSMKEHGDDTKESRGKGANTTNTKGYNVTDSAKEYDFTVAENVGDDYKVQSQAVGGTTTDRISTYDNSLRDLQSSTTTPNPATSTMTEIGKRGSRSDTASKEKTSHDFSRSGNIGVMTATDMLKSDSEFWSANDFFSIIASNIASLVTNPYYE